MRWNPLLVASLWIAAHASPGWAVDYGTIARTIKVEAAYRSKSPQYALLLFGRQATMRVWVVLDGGTLFLDRNGDGDLRGTDECFASYSKCKNIELADPDNKTRYTITGISDFKEENSSKVHLLVNIDIRGPISYRQYGEVVMAENPWKAAVAHFHGPLTMGPATVDWKLPPKLAIASGDKPVELQGMVGTVNAEHGCWVVVRSHNGEKSAFPKGVFPVVDVEFPPRIPGAPAVKKRYALDRHC